MEDADVVVERARSTSPLGPRRPEPTLEIVSDGQEPLGMPSPSETPEQAAEPKARLICISWCSLSEDGGCDRHQLCEWWAIECLFCMCYPPPCRMVNRLSLTLRTPMPKRIQRCTNPCKGCGYDRSCHIYIYIYPIHERVRLRPHPSTIIRASVGMHAIASYAGTHAKKDLPQVQA